MQLNDLPQILPDHTKRYSFPAFFFFKTEHDTCHAFVMKDFEQGMHVQEFFEINIITHGAGAHYIENNRLMASVGDVFVIPPNVRHGYLGGEGFDVLHIIISDRFWEREYSELMLLRSFSTLFHTEPIFRATSPEQLHLKLSEEQLTRLMPIINELIAKNDMTDISSAIIRRGLVLSLISMMCDAYTANHEGVDSSSSLDKAFLEALSMIHERYYEKITIDLLAKTALLSRSAFIRKFKAVYGIPPAKYLEKRRIDAACHMLKSTVLPINEIAQRAGFHDSSHLTRSFIGIMEISPGQYRKGFSSKSV